MKHKSQVIHHCVLSDQGGTAMVAGLIRKGLELRGWGSRVQSEEDGSGRFSAKSAPSIQDPGSVFHIHSTMDWAGTLLSGRKFHRKPVVTLHDAALLTGGCVYPLECRKWMDGCAQCPRGYNDSFQNWKQKREAVRAVRPVLVSPSGWLAGMARSAFGDLTVEIVPNGVVPEIDLTGDMQGLPDFQGKLVLFVAHGGIKAGYKSGTKWLDIWEGIKEADPSARALFIGNESTGKARDVFQLPYLPNHAVRFLMRKASVLVYPSMADNHPLVILEAFFSRLPVVAFAVGGIPEQVRPGKTGILVRPGDFKGLAQETVQILKQPARSRAMAEQAFELARDKFSDKRMVDDYIRIYKDAL
ncbi:MAG: glycosyltransferase [Desulfonatronovibrio sp.]